MPVSSMLVEKCFALFGKIIRSLNVSRVGKKIINVPDKVTLDINGNLIKAKGQKGTLEFNVPEPITFALDGKTLTFARPNDLKHVRALHGLSRALTSNMIEGVDKGFSKSLQIEGVGFKAEMKGKNLLLSLGFSHPIVVLPPLGIEISTPTANTIAISGIDKQIVGEVAAKIRALKKPEPYKGKGVKYVGEYIRRKAGKTTGK
jgi:large subunit ribosomal protein L6